jgi:hypothetical protein
MLLSGLIGINKIVQKYLKYFVKCSLYYCWAYNIYMLQNYSINKIKIV